MCLSFHFKPTNGLHASLLFIKARFHYERGMEYSLLVSLSAKTRKEVKKSIKQTKNAPVHARSGNGFLHVLFKKVW